MKAGWVWRMPGQDAAKAILENAKVLKNPEDAQQKEVSTFGKIEHLRNDAGAADADRRPGRERWPGLIDTKGGE